MARIPFVAGIDRYLPASFGRPHPRYGSPYVALLTQAGVTVVFVILGQAGTTVKGAYEVLISMTFLVTFIPFLFLFASAIKLHVEPPPAGTLRIPGGRTTVIVTAALGFVTTLGSMALTVFPPPDDPNPALAVTKVVGLTLLLLGIGIAVYQLGRRRATMRSLRMGQAFRGPGRTVKRWVKSESMAKASPMPSLSMMTKLRQSTELYSLSACFAR